MMMDCSFIVDKLPSFANCHQNVVDEMELLGWLRS